VRVGVLVGGNVTVRENQTIGVAECVKVAAGDGVLEGEIRGEKWDKDVDVLFNRARVRA
jgi:hypothetical protein